MSFFIRQKAKVKPKKIDKNAKKPKKIKLEDIVSSDSDENGGLDGSVSESEEEPENETVQEKRLKLAKAYLAEIEIEEKNRLGADEEVDEQVISSRLRDDYLKQIGRFRSQVADEYVQVSDSDVIRLKNREQRGSITCVAVSPDSKFAYSGSKDGVVVKWSLEEMRKIKVLPHVKVNRVLLKQQPVKGHSKNINALALPTDGKYLASADGTNDIKVWNPETMEFIGKLSGHRAAVMDVVFRRGTHTLYSCSNDKSVKAWSVSDMSYIETVFGHQNAVLSIDSMLKERAVTAGGSDSTLRIWKFAEESQLVYNSSGCVDVVRFINDDHFATGNSEGELSIWSAMRKKPICTVKSAHGLASNGIPLGVNSVAALVNTDLMASGSSDGFIRLWKLTENFRKIDEVQKVACRGFVNALAFTPDGNALIAGIGKDERNGRWTVISDAVNSIVVIKLKKK